MKTVRAIYRAIRAKLNGKAPEPITKVWVVMQNDFPISAHKSPDTAFLRGVQVRQQQEVMNREYGGFRYTVHCRTYEFTLED